MANDALKALLLAKQRGENPEQVDSDNSMQGVLQPGLNSLQAKQDAIIKNKLQREAGLEQFGGRAPLSEGEVRAAPGVAPVQQEMDDQYSAAMRLKTALGGEMPSGAVGQALQQVDDEGLQDPTQRAARFKAIREFLNKQGR